MLDAATSAEVNGVAHCDRLTSRLVRPTPVEIETGSQTASRYKYLSMRRPSLCIPTARVRTESDSLVSSCHKGPRFPDARDPTRVDSRFQGGKRLSSLRALLDAPPSARVLCVGRSPSAWPRGAGDGHGVRAAGATHRRRLCRRFPGCRLGQTNRPDCRWRVGRRQAPDTTD